MTQPLKRAILSVFQEGNTAGQCGAHLSVFVVRDWARRYRWLDSSGLALYFLDRLKTLGIESVLPGSMLAYLERNQAATIQRMGSTFADFAIINERLQASNISYFNTKGFALASIACHNPALRIQLNIDLVMSADDADLCHDALADLGYSLARYSEHVWDFEAGYLKFAYPMNIYEVPPPRAIRIYAVSSTKASHRVAYQQLLNKRVRSWNGCTFPVASDADAFINQSLHIFGRICSEWIRLSWLIEFKLCLDFWREDDAFLQDVLQKAQSSPHRMLAMGVALALVKLTLGAIIPYLLEESTIHKLNTPVRLWIQQYADEALMADYPGTKRYRFLKPLLPQDGNVAGDERQNTQTPFVFSRGANVLRQKQQGHPYVTISAKMLRLHFHIREHLRNAASAGQWRRLLAETRAEEMRRNDDIGTQ